MIMTLERHIMKKLELEQDRLLCKEVDHQQDIGKLHQQRLRVLFKKMKDHGIQLNLELSSRNMSLKLLKLLRLRILKKHQEQLLIDFWMIMTLERHIMKKLELEQDRLLCKEVDHQQDIGKLHQQRLRVLFKEMLQHHGTQQNLEQFLMLMSRRLLKS
jgi:hypothetical protein